LSHVSTVYNKKTARVDDPSDLITRVRVLIRSLGSSTRAGFCLSYTTIVKKVVPFDESCPGTHTGYRIFLSHGDFASQSAGFLGSIFIIILLK
jgi:hypothetical protein